MLDPQEPHTRASSTRSLSLVRELGFALVGLLAGTLVLEIPMTLGLFPDEMKAAGLSFLYGPLVTVMAAGIYAWLVRRVDGTPPTDWADSPRPNTGKAMAWVSSHIVLALVGSTAITTLSKLAGLPIEEQAGVLDIVESAAGTLTPELVMLITSAIALAPVCEEWLFRGLLFRRSYVRATPLAAFWISALAFAIVHGHAIGIPVYFWLGLVFADIYVRTQRLWCAMLVHALNNTAALVILLFVDEIAVL